MMAILNFSRRVRDRVLQKTALYWGLLVVLLAAFVCYERTLGLTYPMPWPDEALFLWQALAVRDGSTLLAPELNDERPIFLMPYGYMVLQGLVFKVTGFSLTWARTLSALYLAGTVVCIAYIARRFTTRFALLLLCAGFLSVPCVRFAANTARMETLVTLLAGAGFVLLSRGRTLAGLSSLSLAPLVHPNGHFVVLSGVFYVAGMACVRKLAPRYVASVESGLPVERRAARSVLRNWEWIVAALAGLTWLWFLVYFSRHSADFVIDLARQLSWKSSEIDESGTASWRFQNAWYWGPVLLLGVGGVAALRFAPAVLPLAALSFGLMLRAIATVGWNYECHTALAYLCLAIVLLEVAAAALEQGFPRARALPAVASAAAGVVMGALLFQAGSRAPIFLHTVRQSAIEVPGHQRSAYWNERDYHAVVDYLSREQAAAKRPLRVSFFPVGDALLFADARSPSLRFTHYAGSAFRRVDVIVLHDSPWHTEHQKAMTIIAVGVKQGVELPIEKWQAVSRSKGNVWTVYSRALGGG